MTDDELDRLDGLARAATPGPWKASIEGRDHFSGSHVILTGGEDIEMTGASLADHDFVAAARQAVPALIAEVRALRARLAAR
jgi:hypothetical protein